MEEKYIPVCKGEGLYHTAKAQYSKETQQLVKQLLQESKLSTLQRLVLNNAVKNGDALPKPSKIKSKITVPNAKSNKPQCRRTQKSILESGAYEREKFSPIKNKPPYDEEKKRLQSLMAYGKDIPIYSGHLSFKDNENKTPEDERKEMTKDEVYENLLFEIEERAQFLDDMDQLGQKKNYKEVIENEITYRMRQMEMLDKERYKKQTGTVEKFRKKSEIKPKSLILNSINDEF